MTSMPAATPQIRPTPGIDKPDGGWALATASHNADPTEAIQPW
jgi:hypothetical protein